MDFDLSDVINILKQRIVLLLSIIIPSVFITGWISFAILPPQYEAVTTLLVQTQNPSTQINYNDLITNEKLIATYGEIIKSKRIAREVIDKLNLKVTEDELLKKVTASGVKESLVTEIKVKYTNQAKAAAIANGFADSFQKNLPLIMKVENVSILDQAIVNQNSKPVSPNPYMNMFIVFLLALNISIVISILLEVIDKTIKTEESVEEMLGLPVLGTIPKGPSKKLEIRLRG
ncbi:YveK family protein [Bacillus taeanensis]|uniref:Chain-length determining protein n=1 Tax=Bacillus taeanensis TaxID=273032 RepID=A0A366XV53_9BACI|nr:Wzz/FepE/Etk N-terminal domain-containing protein [Bacillus taeanensis]RBW68014.1 chain-length determining protein [Bacillus taeanensis]